MKNYSWKGILFLLVPCVSLPVLSGCMAASLASLAPNIGSLADADSMDAGEATLQLSTTPKHFVNDASTVAHELGYQLASAENQDGARGIVVYKQLTNWGAALIGKDWRTVATIELQKDGHTVIIETQIKGNNHRADPGTGKKAAEEIKAKFIEFYRR